MEKHGAILGRTICLVCLMLIFPAKIIAQNILVEVLIIGGLSPLNRIIEKNQIEHFNKHDLRLLRNTIFAKYGYIFKSDDLRKHFSRFSWYNGSKVTVLTELTGIDWINIALIQSLEETAATTYQNVGNIGENFVLSGKIAGGNDSGGFYSADNRRIRREGFAHNMEIIAKVHTTVIARQKITDNNEFRLDLSNIPSDALRHWEDGFDKGWLHCSDPETKLRFLSLDGYSDLYGQEWPTSFTEYGLRNDDDYNDIFNYIYSDRDATIRGAMDGEPYTNSANRKFVINFSLKKGWNKTKLHRTSAGEYLILLHESSSGTGIFLTLLRERG